MHGRTRGAQRRRRHRYTAGLPYAAYKSVDWNVITQTGGDVMSMAVVRLLESLESVKIVRQCIDQIPEGPILRR